MSPRQRHKSLMEAGSIWFSTSAAGRPAQTLGSGESHGEPTYVRHIDVVLKIALCITGKNKKMNKKAKGCRNEHRSMAILEAAGYRCTRSAASLGAWDIIGIGCEDTVLVQVKTRDWPGASEMEVLRQF